MQKTIKQLNLMSVALLSAAPMDVAEEETIIATDAYSWRGDTIYQGTYKAWGGVWTRDVSYSIILSMAYMQPTASMVSLIYANGNGPTSTENKCAVRTLSADGKEIGMIVMPQRGSGEWTDWGRSSILKLPLKSGHHTLTIDLRPENENMNLVTNHAAIDRIELVRIKDGL